MSDIGLVIEQPDNYEILRASALLRQFLVDSNRLVDIANREAKLKLVFEVADKWETPHTKLILSMKPTFFAIFDGLSPETMLVKAPVKVLNRDKFLAYRVAYVDGAYLSVRDIIDHCSNVMGGVHVGAPRSESQKTLSGLQAIEVGGASVGIRQLVPILRVVHKAMKPLVQSLCK